MLKNKSKGFTLIELVIVVFILFILIAIVLPKFLNYRDIYETIKNDKQLEETIEFKEKSEDNNLWSFYSQQIYTYLDMDKIR